MTCARGMKRWKSKECESEIRISNAEREMIIRIRRAIFPELRQDYPIFSALAPNRPTGFLRLPFGF